MSKRPARLPEKTTLRPSGEKDGLFCCSTSIGMIFSIFLAITSNSISARPSSRLAKAASRLPSGEKARSRPMRAFDDTCCATMYWYWSV